LPSVQRIVNGSASSSYAGPENFQGWRDRAPYNETAYLQSLQRRGSHLARKLNQQLPKAA